MLAGEAVRQLVLVGNQKLLVLRTPSQILNGLSEEQLDELERGHHPFYAENGHLLHMGPIDETKEATTRFKIYDEMIESYIFLNNGNFRVCQTKDEGNGIGCFEVRTEEDTRLFSSSKTREWVHLLN